MTQNFNNAKIYNITNDYNDEVYIGSTCDTLIKRFSAHKSNRKAKRCSNRPLYKLMNEIGIERFRIDLVEDYSCNDKQELRQREGFWIREQGTLNKRIDGQTQKEYRQQNSDKIKQNMKEYYQQNSDKIKERTRQYVGKHKEEKKENDRKYQQKNAEKIKLYMKQYRLKKKEEKLLQQTTE